MQSFNNVLTYMVVKNNQRGSAKFCSLKIQITFTKCSRNPSPDKNINVQKNPSVFFGLKATTLVEKAAFCKINQFLTQKIFHTVNRHYVLYGLIKLWKITSSDARNSQQLFRVEKTTLLQAKTGKHKCRNVTATYVAEESSCYVFSTRNNCCEFLASDGVIFQSAIKPFF